jgi:hypothetical protein
MEASPNVKCVRCGGTMVYETFYGPSREFGGFRCMICGEIIDPVILENRKMMQTGQRVIYSGARV